MFLQYVKRWRPFFLLIISLGPMQMAVGDLLYSEGFPGDGPVGEAGWHGASNLSSRGGVVGDFAWVWHSGNCTNLIYTDEYTADTSIWSSVRFEWRQRINYNGTTPAVSLAVRVGDAWYVSKATFVTTTRDYALCSYTYDPAAAHWDALNVATAARGPGASVPLNGNITAFGLYSDTAPVGGLDCTAEYDDFRVTALPLGVPEYRGGRSRTDFNAGWRFLRGDVSGNAAAAPQFDDGAWEKVDVPHNPPVTPGEPDPARPRWVTGYSYEGVSWYRKRFTLDSAYAGAKVFLAFEAVNTVAEVWVNGVHLSTHVGGYLPFTVDITAVARFGEAQENVVAVKADNTDNPNIPIGNESWFNWGGVYRNVRLVVTDRLHVTDPVHANKAAGGGVFVTFPRADPSVANVQVRTHVINENATAATCAVRSTLLDADGLPAATSETAGQSISAGGGDHEFAQSLTVSSPKLWHPNHPYRYLLRTQVVRDGVVVDELETRVGIRRIEFTRAGGFKINGETLRFMGANRMQDFPYVGYAMTDNGQRRDAILLKEAGFQFIRTSQYPQSAAFLDACDELGLMVLAPIPGFQHFGAGDFRAISYQNMRDLIRRDRNRPSVVLWELSLNETWWTDPEYSPNAVAIGHEEYPGDQMYVGGWKDIGVWGEPALYDVALRNADHDPSAWDYAGPLPLVINEYGHWRYRSNPPNHTSDVHRAEGMPDGGDGGEQAMLGMASNHQESLNIQRGMTSLCGDALWVGMDYAQYAQGILDNFRVPKFSYYFFQSQRDPGLLIPGIDSGPMVFIASYWTAASPADVRVYSNCEQVKLYLNGNLVAARSPDTGPNADHLSHPPFTFAGLTWESGELRAEGYIGGQHKATHVVKTPGPPASLNVAVDLRGCDWPVWGRRILFLYAKVLDGVGTLVPIGSPMLDPRQVTFEVHGPGKLISPATVDLEAGVATALVETSAEQPGLLRIQAETPGLPPREAHVLVNLNADADRDGDGLANRAEEVLGTDPLNADTDGDGMSDGDEVAFGRNPLVGDNETAQVPALSASALDALSSALAGCGSLVAITLGRGRWPGRNSAQADP